MLIKRLNAFPTVSRCFQTLKEPRHLFDADHYCTFRPLQTPTIVLYTYSRKMHMSMLKDYRSSIEELTAG